MGRCINFRFKVNLTYFLLAILVLFLPINWRVLIYLIPVWIIGIIVTGGKEFWTKDFIRNFKQKKWLLFFLLANLISILYSSDLSNGLKNIETQLSLIIFPLFIGVIINKKQEGYILLMKIFIIGVVISIVWNCANFIFSENFRIVIEWMGRSNLFEMIRYYGFLKYHHPTYYSFMLIWSIIILIKFYKDDLAKSKLKAILLGGLSMLFVAIIILLSSRAAILCLIFLVFYYSYKYLKESSFWMKIVAPMLIVIFLLPIIKFSRFNSNLHSLKNSSSIEEIDIRLSLWRNAFIVWKEKPIFGHGVGDAKQRMLDVYKDQKMSTALTKTLNAHNQFIETAIQTGLVGLFMLLLVFVIPIYQSIKKKQELLFLFLAICMVNFMFETMFHRLAGVIFFAFWYSFLWFVYYKDDKVIENEK